jgi:hypothetical protein
MVRILCIAIVLSALPGFVAATDTTTSGASGKVARSKVDPAKEAEHTKADVQRHRQMAAAHEAAAKCQESGKDEDLCNAELAKACKGIAYGKYCGMKHAD